MDRDTIRLECLRLAINRGSNVAEVVANAKVLEDYMLEEPIVKPAKSGKAGNSESLQSRTTTRKD